MSGERLAVSAISRLLARPRWGMSDPARQAKTSLDFRKNESKNK